MSTTRRFIPRRGFSLLEIMLVLVIMGTLVTIVIVNITARGETARVRTTTITMRQLESALKEFQFTEGAYPTTAEGGLALLVPQYIAKMPLDAWKREFFYLSPTDDPTRPYLIISLGPDGVPDTEDDILSWDIDS